MSAPLGWPVESGHPGPPLAATGRVNRWVHTAHVVWRREMIHLSRDRARIGISLLQPLLFLLVLGAGFATVAPGSGPGGVDYRSFLFPGVLVMSVQGPAVSAGASIVWDRQTGFLREMLVAPVPRSALLLGKCAGGATMATVQGAVVLAFARFGHVPYRPVLLAELLAEMALTAFVLTALGATLAVVIRRAQTFQTTLSVLLAPMLFLSGAFVPVSSLPAALAWPARANPLSYAVDAVRHAVSGHLTSPVGGGVTWAGWRLPAAVELALVAAFGAAFLLVGTRRFARVD